MPRWFFRSWRRLCSEAEMALSSSARCRSMLSRSAVRLASYSRAAYRDMMENRPMDSSEMPSAIELASSSVPSSRSERARRENSTSSTPSTSRLMSANTIRDQTLMRVVRRRRVRM